MLCDICKKNVATVHLTEIIDDQIAELHLCEACAREKSIQMEQQFGLSDLLAGLAEFSKQLEEEKEIKLKCDNCGLSYDNFKKIGRLGCSLCYKVFSRNLSPLLKKIHGSNQHLGKFPKRVSKVLKTRLELQELKSKLQRAIQLEEFEEAAKIRDKIREIERKNKSSKEKK